MGQSHSQSLTHISALPSEVMFMILRYLPPQELKSAVLVCKALREMGEKPRLWTWAVITVKTKDDFLKLKLPRLQMVREIDVSEGSHCGCGAEVQCTCTGLAELFQVINEIPTVRRIRGLEFCRGIDNIEVDLVVSVLNRLEELYLCYGGDYEEGVMRMQLKLNIDQLVYLLDAVAKKTNLKFLEFSGQDTEFIMTPKTVALALSNVEEVRMKNEYVGIAEDIPDEQFEALYSMIAVEDRPMRKFTTIDYIDDESNHHIDPELLSRACNRLDEVIIVGSSWPDMDIEYVTAILKGLVEEESRLKRLKMNISVILDDLDQDLVRRAEERFGIFYQE